jgi:K(+)-stimulated pyrophosphate-energized sodium pump
MNPIIKFSTLFGLLAVELAVTIEKPVVRLGLAALFFVIALIFVYRSFFGMLIETTETPTSPARDQVPAVGAST